MKVLMVLFLGAICSAQSLAELAPADVLSLPTEQVERRLPTANPQAYYVYALRLFNEQKKEEALFWLYVGELRFRFAMNAEPDETIGWLGLLGALENRYGEPIWKWASGDVENSVRSIDDALKWDAANDNAFTSKKEHADALRKTRDWLKDRRRAILQDRGNRLRELGAGDHGTEANKAPLQTPRSDTGMIQSAAER
jgi:hypothetical protein